MPCTTVLLLLLVVVVLLLLLLLMLLLLMLLLLLLLLLLLVVAVNGLGCTRRCRFVASIGTPYRAWRSLGQAHLREPLHPCAEHKQIVVYDTLAGAPGKHKLEAILRVYSTYVYRIPVRDNIYTYIYIYSFFHLYVEFSTFRHRNPEGERVENKNK